MDCKHATTTGQIILFELLQIKPRREAGIACDKDKVGRRDSQEQLGSEATERSGWVKLARSLQTDSNSKT